MEPKKKRYFENVTVINETAPRVYPKPKPPTPPPEVTVEPMGENEAEEQSEAGKPFIHSKTFLPNRLGRLTSLLFFFFPKLAVDPEEIETQAEEEDE